MPRSRLFPAPRLLGVVILALASSCVPTLLERADRNAQTAVGMEDLRIKLDWPAQRTRRTRKVPFDSRTFGHLTLDLYSEIAWTKSGTFVLDVIPLGNLPLTPKAHAFVNSLRLATDATVTRTPEEASAQ